MSYYRGIMHKMNKIHERSLHLQLKTYKDDFQDLLRSSGDILIHQGCINSLLTEVHKYSYGLSPGMMNEVSSTRVNIYNTWQFNVFETDMDLIWYLTKPTNSGTYSWKPQIISFINSI